jgi:hypothetical protein
LVGFCRLFTRIVVTQTRGRERGNGTRSLPIGTVSRNSVFHGHDIAFRYRKEEKLGYRPIRLYGVIPQKKAIMETIKLATKTGIS